MGTQQAADAQTVYDRVAPAYASHFDGPFWSLYDEVTWEAARPKGDSLDVLDAGAGDGRFAARFLAGGHRVTLLDPSPKMLEAARTRLGSSAASATFLVGGIERIERADESFDFVFSEGDPLSYCLDAGPVAAGEILRVLRPGGSFYVSVDNRWLATFMFLARGDFGAARAAAERGDSLDPYGLPVHAYDPDELAMLFRDAGASDVRVAGKVAFSHLLPASAMARIAEDAPMRDRLAAFERRLSSHPGFAGLASHLHVTGRKPA